MGNKNFKQNIITVDHTYLFCYSTIYNKFFYATPIDLLASFSLDQIFKGCVRYIFASLVSMSDREHL